MLSIVQRKMGKYSSPKDTSRLMATGSIHMFLKRWRVRMAINLDADKLYHKLTQAGDDWAEKQAAYNVLEDTKNAVLSKLMLNSKAPSVAAKEIEAKASDEYTGHVEKTQEAMKAALKAKVNYEAIKIWIDLKRTEAANERVLAKL
jgi:hypothetical protein